MLDFIELLRIMFLAALPAVGFAVIFHTPKKFILLCAVLSSTLYVVFMILTRLGLQPILGSFIAVFFIALICHWCGNFFKTSDKVFSIPAIVVLLPLEYAYQSITTALDLVMHGFQQEIFQRFISASLTTIAIVTAMAAALLLPGLIKIIPPQKTGRMH